MEIDGETLRELALKVSQYFLDFLDSDFKRQEAPRRRIVLQTEAGFRSGMRVAAYPALQHTLWQILEKRAEGDQAPEFQPRVYTRAVSASLRGLVREQIQAITETSLRAIRSEVVVRARAFRGRAVDDPEAQVDEVRALLAGEVARRIVRPLLAALDGPLCRQALSVRDSIFSAEMELVALIAARLDRVLPQVLGRCLAGGDDAALVGAVETLLTLGETRAAFGAYFDAFTASDAYEEFRDLATYATAGENLQFYLYIGALRHARCTYPLFYVPLEVRRMPDGAGYTFSLVNHLYANKRAIDFVLQELGERRQRAWLSPIKDRITYLTADQSIAETARPLFRRIAAAMDLGGRIDLDVGKVVEASDADVALSSALHLAVFDRADEALLNDYEEMIAQARKNEDGVVSLFEGIVRGVLLEDPQDLHEAVEDEWNRMPLVDRVVVDAPAPLNEEQIKILSAIRHPEGRIVVVEGPPGTGKSHTITAIAADCALHGRSCLVLSDKAEALNVVQAKLTDAMSQVRHDKNFPNPILRLGQDQANFKHLTSNQALTQVSAYVRAAKANQPHIRSELAETRGRLKQQISQTVETLGSLSLGDIARVFEGEARIAALSAHVIPDLQTVTDEALLPLLDRAVEAGEGVEPYFLAAFSALGTPSAVSLIRRVRLDAFLLSIAQTTDPAILSLFDRLTVDQVRLLQASLLEYEQLRMPVLGYLLRGGEVRAIERRLASVLRPNRPLLFKLEADTIRGIIERASSLRTQLPAHGLVEGDLADAYEALSCGRLPPAGATLSRRFVEALDKALRNGLPSGMTPSAPPEKLSKLWIACADYLRSWIRTSQAFVRAPEFDYVGTKSQLELLNITIMNAEVDDRLVSFMNNFRADARALASVITQRQKFPEDKFGVVKESFPVILASIRQFGEYMPLAPDLFDVVVIDEASQVSVAQAFPALLRARKIVVMGDSKQFSNTKSSNASIALNQKYKSDLETFFRQRVSQDAAVLQRLVRFDVKCSILDFCQTYANYSTVLKKHFRSYPELISYSSQTFYGGQLQAIKIREAPLEDVIRFDLVEPDPARATRGTNGAEADFIVERLIELLGRGNPPSVGIITPFREQQTLLSRRLFSHARGGEFQSALDLKVMTFDSCQGEERQVVFYSMVATARDDALNYIFPVELRDAEDSVEEKLKVQRLNVGFSRAQEMIWFVLSKPIADFKGAIGRTLEHYARLLERTDASADGADPANLMEARVLGWLEETRFYRAHSDVIEVLPRFPIGDYLRQLDPAYQHPVWRVDILVTVATGEGVARIVVEYDGFEHDFQKGKDVNVGNPERYMLEGDIERQLTLESYGYRFLRVNRFNLGKDPVNTLSGRLQRLVDALTDDHGSDSVDKMREVAAGLATRTHRDCARCRQIRPLAAFFDQRLRDGEGGHGRICTHCKKAAASEARDTGPAVANDVADRDPGAVHRWGDPSAIPETLGDPAESEVDLFAALP